jgi:pilus assembly protein CpaF
LQSIAPNDRVVVIEDTSEIQLANSNVVRLEARRAQEGLPAISVRNLLRTCLRLRPDRIILGEVRDGDAFDLLQALNCGHAGTISTIHANAAELAISRFATCVLQSGIELPYRAIRSNIAEALQIIVHLDRINGRRIVTNVIEVRHYEPETDRFSFEALFSHHHP